MKRSVLLLALLLVLGACGTDEGGESAATVPDTTTTTEALPATTTTVAPVTTTTEPAFPMTVDDDAGPVTLEEEPRSIVSLSSTATEMLFAIGAGDQVIAVDDQSNYPDDAPITDLSAFTPNVEAILAYEPDLVIVAYDPGDLLASLGAAGVPALTLGAAMSLDDTYRQIEILGAATGHADDAAMLSEAIEADLDELVGSAPEVPEDTTYYHELDNTLYSATSTTFIGQIYSMFGLSNIADAADEDGSAFGYPQLSGEYVVSSDPDLIFLANAFYGESAQTVGERPGWDVLTAVQEGNVVELDSDVVSRWGPRIVEFAGSLSYALEAYANEAG